ncbi:MAG: Maf family protein [Treponema sp.]|jgi:septum formation protein|nr:Maf family protein [Treponema sp.]
MSNQTHKTPVFFPEPIILASSSPRRHSILTMLGIPFIPMPPHIDESLEPGIPAEKMPELLAIKKAETVAAKLPAGIAATLVLGVDTLVILDGKPYGKPVDAAEAEGFLTALSGRTHRVVTAMALHNRRTGYTSSQSCETAVTFAPLAKEDILWYLNTGEWQGVAGAYRMQGRGACFVSHIAGLESTVAGLPIEPLFRLLKDGFANNESGG